MDITIGEVMGWALEFKLAEQDIYRQSLQDKQREIKHLREELSRLHKIIAAMSDVGASVRCRC